MADVLTLGSASGRVADEQLIYLLGAENFYIATDADEAGEVAAGHWLDAVGKRGWRVRPPGSLKDVSESFQHGAALWTWAWAALNARWIGRDLPLNYQDSVAEEAWWAAASIYGMPDPDPMAAPDYAPTAEPDSCTSLPFCEGNDAD